MTTIYSSKPHAYMFGVKDESARQLPVEPIALSAHLPYMFFFAEKGPSTPQLIRGNGAVRMYGSRSFEETSEYCTHQTPFINAAFNDNNPMILQRIVPEAAKTAILRLSVEVIPAELPMYERNIDGSIKYEIDAYDQRVPVIDQTQTVDGHRLVFHTSLEPFMGQVGVAKDAVDGRHLFGGGHPIEGYRGGETTAKQGNLKLGKDGEVSTLYPIFDLLVSDPGAYGNRLGMRIQLPTTKSNNALDVSSVYSNLAYIPRIALVERSNTGESVKQLETNLGELFLDVCFKEGSRTDRTNIQLDFEKRVVSSFQYRSNDNSVNVEAPFNKIHVYRDNIQALTDKLIEKEEVFNAQRESYGSMAISKDTPLLLNFLGGFDENAVRYYSIDTLNSAMFDGILLTNDSTVFAQLGDDGLPRKASGEFDTLAIYEMFDRKIRQLFENIGETTIIQFKNYAKYPLSAIWDTGFSLETKKTLLNALAYRKDVGIVLSTFASADYKTKLVNGRPQKVFQFMPALSIEEELSIATYLKTHAAMFPESEVYGTKVCRAMIVGYSGKIINSLYTRLCPVTYDYFVKVLRFMGNSTGVWNGELAYDTNPNNIVDTMSDISINWLDQHVGNQAWARGMVYVEDYDTNRLFFPGIRTVYSDETSVLNSSITMWAICLIERVCHQTWRDLSGNSKWTPAKFLEKSDQLIEERLKGVFDDRFIIRPETTYTGADEVRGFSWTTKVHIYASNMKTVGAYTVVSHRMEDYLAGSNTNG